MHTHADTHTRYSDGFCIVHCGNKEGERLQMTHNPDIITMFVIDCIPSITMKSICITAGAIKLQCDVCLREDFTLVIKPYASVNMKCCQCISSLSISVSLCVCLYCWLFLCWLNHLFYYGVISPLHTRDPFTCRFCTYINIKW